MLVNSYPPGEGESALPYGGRLAVNPSASLRAGVDCQFYLGDVTHLAFLADPFDLALDIGCLHSLPPEGCRRYVAKVARLLRPGGLYLLYAFTPWPDWSPPRGVAPQEVRRLFAPAFVVEREEIGEDPSGLRSAWYWLRRLCK